ncbi:MAG: hypothetical protein GY928_21550 [Colwellia sp.]|nr:hypothetical protein [Colwellia sp.]
MSVEGIIQDELIKHKPEDRPVMAQMLRDKLTGTNTSKNDYKKLMKIQKRIRKARIKSERL